MFHIMAERPDDAPEIESLLDRAFGPARRAKTSYRYREGVPPLGHLGLVARAGDDLVGTLRCWPVGLNGVAAVPEVEAPPVLLGPVAVAPARRGRGIGAALVTRALVIAARAGHPFVALVGPHAYYGRWGFRPAADHGLVMPGEAPDRFLVRELAAGALATASGPILPRRCLRDRGADRPLTRLGRAA